MLTAAGSCARRGWARARRAARERSPYLPARGRAFVASGDSLIVLDARSGAVLHAVPTGIGTLAGNPVAVAVDERLCQVFVANASLPDADSPWDNSLVLLNTRTGDVLGNLPLDACRRPGPSVIAGRVTA
jgi:hypothetical protein